MEPALLNEVPSLDLADFNSGNKEQKEKFVAELGAAFTNIGFVAIKNHGLSDTLREQLYEVVQRFFAQPEEKKRSYERPDLFGQRGYISKQPKDLKLPI